MKVLNYLAIGTIALAGTFASCKKEGCTDATATNYDEKAEKDDGSCEFKKIEEEEEKVAVPTNYEFTRDGQSTVSYNGQAQRLEMLSEMTTYLKTANTSGTAVDAATLKKMYDNSSYTWADADNLGMTGSSKQLKSKTAGADPTIQAYFETLMDQIGTASASTTTGTDDGANGTAGVVVSSNGQKKYLQNAEGKEWVQLIEKGLMGAVFYNQIQQVYLGPGKMDVDNESAVDPDNGKYYTEMEHHWDEAYGYFTTAVDYPTSGTDRFWGKYANGREGILGSATKIDEAFRKGRTAIANKDMAERDAQIVVIRAELEKVTAGTAIHYLNSANSNFADNALRNHALSEAEAFMRALPFGDTPIATQADVDGWVADLGNFYTVQPATMLSVRNEIASKTGLTDVQGQL